LRVGDTPKRDLARIAAVRKAYGDDLVILTDANTGYSLADRARPCGHGRPWRRLARRAVPGARLSQLHRGEKLRAGAVGAGENHYTVSNSTASSRTAP